MDRINPIFRFSVALGATALCSSTLAVTLVSDDRIVSEFSGAGAQSFTPDAPFAPFSVNGQSTTVTAEQFSGSGDGYGESDFDFFVRESTFDVTFDVTEPTLIDLGGNYEAAPGNFGLARVLVAVFEGETPIYSSTLTADDFDPVFDTFAFTDSLGVGTYRLVIDTEITPGGFDTYGIYNFVATFSADDQVDSDGDGVLDQTDNCTNAPNPGQQDANGDGYGNACDADLNDDCVVNVLDLGLLRTVFLTADAVADFNSDGVVNVLDLGTMRAAFFGAPGPSATGNCPAN